jgi:hypothetical protein
MEELLMNPSQRQIIPLQSRPYENDSVSGTLTVEVITFQKFHQYASGFSNYWFQIKFLFIDGVDVPNSLPSGVATSATKMTSCNSSINFIFIKHHLLTFNNFVQLWMPKAA